MGELRESSVARRSLRSINNPWTHGRAPEITTVAQPDGDEASVIVVYHPDDTQEEEPNEDMDEETEERYSPIIIPLTRSRQKVEMAPIKWMKGQARFTPKDALNGRPPSLSITLPELLDCSPWLLRDLAELRRSSVPRVLRKKATSSSGITEPSSIHSSKLTLGHEVTSEASPGPEGDKECLYMEAWVANYKIREVLVDAGAMLDLISTQLVDKLRLERFPVTGLGIRLAEDRLVLFKNYVWLDIVVAGVFARIKAYEVAVSQTYQLLLSRRWFRRVKAVEYQESRTLFIEGSAGVRRKVPGIPIDPRAIKLENTDTYTYCDLEDEEAEEALDTLLNELDHWNTKGEEERDQGNQ